MDRVKCATWACALKRKVFIALQPERNLGSDHVVLALMPPRNDLAVSEMVCVCFFQDHNESVTFDNIVFPCSFVAVDSGHCFFTNSSTLTASCAPVGLGSSREVRAHPWAEYAKHVFVAPQILV